MKAAMITILSLALAALPLVGCDNADEADDDTGTDADTDSDTDADTDSDTDSDTDTELDCDGGRLDPNTGLCWQHPIPSKVGDQSEAISYCDDLDLAGQEDWVLPSRDDFVNLLGDCDEMVMSGIPGFCNPCAQSEACNAAFGPDQETYYSSSFEEEQADYVWMANLEAGHLGLHDPADYLLVSVRCVRSTL
jgi:hypothetical protein